MIEPRYRTNEHYLFCRTCNNVVSELADHVGHNLTVNVNHVVIPRRF